MLASFPPQNLNIIWFASNALWHYYHDLQLILKKFYCVNVCICPHLFKNPGKGRCGAGQWTAARESANKSASKLDEEGVEVAVCRHGVLLKGLNMFRGEIFAYPLYLQKQLASQTVQFFCSDVVCKYWPYLQRVVDHCPELEDLLNMRPFLSIMHAKAHSWMCEVIMTIRCISYHLYHTLWFSVLCPYFFSKL